MKIYKGNVTQNSKLKECVRYVLKLIKQINDGFTASVSIHHANGINLSIRSGIVDFIEFNNDLVLSVTLYYQYKKIIISSKDLSKISIQRMISSIMDIFQYVSSDQGHFLPKEDLLVTDSLDLKLYYPCDMTILEVVKLTTHLERIALESDKRIINTEGAHFSSYLNCIIIGNTYGLINSYLTSMHSLSVSVIARDNGNVDCMERDYEYSVSRQFDDLTKISNIGVLAAKKAISRLNSQIILTQKMSLLFSSELSSSFFSYFAHAISGVNVYKKNTFLFNSLGKEIFPTWLCIVDDPFIEKGLGSKPFDLEGVKTKKCSIVKDGKLKMFLVDTYFGYKLGVNSSGHSGGLHNWLILGQSNLNLDELFKYMYTGVYITELMGDGVNLITGTYSLGAVGFLVKYGRIVHPISKITISGNLKDMWKNIVIIGKNVDLRKKIRCGSILLSDIQISGL